MTTTRCETSNRANLGRVALLDDSRYQAFDNDAYLGLSAPTAQANGLQATELAIHGLHCGACAWLIENAASRTAGWKAARVKMNSHTVSLIFDPKLIKLSQIARLTGRLGYELTPITSRPDRHVELENRRLLTRIAVAGFCAANAMWIAIALYAGDASGVSASHRDYLRLIGTGLGVVAVLFPGRTFFTGALASLRTRTPHMDLPVALGLSVGTIVGICNAILGRGDVYFDSLAVLVFLLLLGRWIQFRQQHHAAKAVDLLVRITPRHANRKTDSGQYVLVQADLLKPGDIIRVAAGESIPADGRIETGQSLIDWSLLTGESQPVAATIGDEVFAGTVNVRESVEVRVNAIGRHSRIGKVMQSVEDAMAQRTPVVQLADRVGGLFVVVVTILALVTFLGWLGNGWSVAASNATSLLIVACPCALALATPLAIAVTIGRAAKNKILIRDGGVFQRLARPGHIWFDKTGTLTEGRVTAKRVSGSLEALRCAAAIEMECVHPIADAIVQSAADAGLCDRIPELSEPTKVLFGGVTGRCDGHRVVVGSLAFMQSEDIFIDDDAMRSVTQTLDAGLSPVLIAIDDRVEAVLEVSDRLRPDARQTIARLRDSGWAVGILSGDHPSTVKRIGNAIGIPSDLAIGGLSPEDKLRRVREGVGSKIVMVGDGANDASALAAADVGIAVKGGAEVALQAAPVFISTGDLTSITTLMQGSRNAMRLIETAFAVSLAYNVVAVALAMAGMITPLVAALLMPISSVTVLAMTLAWPTFKVPDSRLSKSRLSQS